MKTFKNNDWKTRNYESENLVAVRGKSAPKSGNWTECDAKILFGLTRLYIQNGVEYWGYL